jgi:hypothetical protein
MPESLRSELWDELLQYYHDTLMTSLTDILKCDRTDIRLKPYSFEKFIEHFTKYAFYGIMICIHFIPWMACSEEECKLLSDSFDTDIFSDEALKIGMEAGGRAVDERVFGVVKHAFEKNYMGFVEEEEF